MTSPWDQADWRAELARQWAARVNRTSYIPMSTSDIERYLADLLDELAAALDGATSIERVGRAVGERMVAAHITGEESLRHSLELLGEHLLVSADPATHSVMSLLTSVASGYAEAVRENIFKQQETIKRALLRSKLRAERDLEASENRFREVFSATPIGVAISDLGGKFVEVNPALEQMLGYSKEEFASRTVYELFHPDERNRLTSLYSTLVEGRTQHLHERCKLCKVDGGYAWTFLAVSVLRDAYGVPHHIVTMVEDLSQLHLLQAQFQHQALHDVSTGLPNRQFFLSRLETALATFDPDTRLTLYQLELDGIDVINEGMGQEVGDGMLKEIARRLDRLVETEDALVARISGNEFAVLYREKPDSPGIGRFAEEINNELGEPVYVGTEGIATTATIGVVQRRIDEIQPVRMLQDSTTALRWAKKAGKRQWAPFDAERAERERVDAKLAAAMPGALELGEFEVLYQPQVSLADGRPVMVEAQLCWEPEGGSRLGHQQCLQLAEQSGVTLCLRDWMLRTAWEQLAAWHRAGEFDLGLAVRLSRDQTQDPDLVATVRSVLEDGELDPAWLRLCVPTSVLVDGWAETRENVKLLASMGAKPCLHSFHASPRELHQLRELPVHGVHLDEQLTALVPEDDDAASPEARAVAAMLPLVRDGGIPIAVGGIATEAQAQRWRSLGCDIGSGPLYGDPARAYEGAEGLVPRLS